MSAGTPVDGKASDATTEGATVIPLKGIRRTAARRMVAAWEAPVFHLTVTVDMTRALSAGKGVEGGTVTDVLLLATAAALGRWRPMNAHYANEAVTLFDRVNIGVAVATEAGLMVPVVHGVGEMSLHDIALARRDVVTRARAGQLGMADVQGGTFTISNLGMLGIDRFDAILNTPQVGILAVGSTVQRPVLLDGQFVPRPVAEMTLTCDHRAVDGATGAGFLADLRAELQGTLNS